MLIDSHCHLPHKNYPKPLDDVINDAQKAGVEKFISIGTSLANNVEVLNVAQKFDCVYCAIAVYPHEEKDVSLEKLRIELEKQLITGKKIVAVGECGLDVSDREYARPLNDQIVLFEMQLDLAVEHHLPVVIHNNGGDEHIMSILDKFIPRGLTGVAHCFSSTWDLAQKYLDRGFYLSFAGRITYKSNHVLREVAKLTPLDRFLVETDAPYLPPEGFRGKPNEPMHVVEVAKKIAEVKDMPFEKIADLSYSNTCTLFSLPLNESNEVRVHN